MFKNNFDEIIKTINEFALLRKVDISKIVLFGSASQDRQSEDSDIDLMIVSKEFSEKTYSERIKNSLV